MNGRTVILLLSAIIFTTPSGSAESSGLVAPGNVAEVDSGGGTWSNVAAAVGSDNVRASATNAMNDNTNVLYFSGFTLDIPANATLDGVGFVTEGQATATGAILVAASLDGGASFVNAPASNGNLLGFSIGSPDSFISHGDPIDDWVGLTVSDVMSPDFGVGLSGTSTIAVTHSVDDVGLVVFYTPVTFLTTGSGDWNTTGTWDSGMLPTTDESVVIVDGDAVSLNAAGACHGLDLGGTLAVSEPGSLSVARDATVGASSNGALFTQGAAGVTVARDLNLDPDSVGSATITFEPTANGSAGLAGIACNDLNAGANVALVLDVSSYSPSLGDAWNVITFAGTRTGSITDVSVVGGSLPPDTQAFITQAKAGAVIVSIVPDFSTLPNTNAYGFAALGVSLAVLGLAYVRRNRRATVSR